MVRKRGSDGKCKYLQDIKASAGNLLSSAVPEHRDKGAAWLLLMIDMDLAAMTDCSPGWEVSPFIPSTSVGIFFGSYSDMIKICTEDLLLKVRARHARLPLALQEM